MSFHWWQAGWIVAILYLALSGLIHWRLWKGTRDLPISPKLPVVLIFILHSALLFGFWSSRGVNLDRPEGLALLLSWLIVGAGLFQWLQGQMEAPSAFVLPLASLLTAYGFTSEGVPRLPPPMSRELLTIHITLLLTAYFLLLLSFSSAVAYLLTLAFLKRKRPLVFLRRLPPLEVADKMTRKWVLLGLPLLIAGMLVGVIWAKAEGRSAWTDPKAILSVLTLLLFLGYLHGRWVRRWEPTVAHIFLLIGCGVLLVTFLVAQHSLAT